MISLRTLLDYLVGRAGAVTAVARHRRSLVLGLVFVVAAGLAREYDGEDLLHQPWHLAIPLVASLATSFVLYVVLWFLGLPVRRSVAATRGETWLGGYAVLLRLYWWTAPLALLYAIPFERFMSPAGATGANLALLSIVALWRVALITRAISVAWRARALWTFFPVMLFADGVAWAALSIVPLPVVSFMGGVRLSESEALLRNVSDWIMFLGALTAPVWLGGSALAIRRLRRSGVREGAPDVAADDEPHTSRVSPGLRAFAAMSVLAWIPILPLTQPEQQRRYALENALRAARFDEAIALVQGTPRDRFPPHWNPPPRPGYGESKPDPESVLTAARAAGAPDWFIEAYEAKAERIRNHRRW